jgi:hypothetical protein
MEIALDYGDLRMLQKEILTLFRTNLACRLNLPLEGIRLSVDFFVSNWSILKGHYSPVIVASCLLSAGYMVHSSTKKTRKILMDVFDVSLSSMQSCLYDVLRSKGIPITYAIGELPELIRHNLQKLIAGHHSEMHDPENKRKFNQ